MNLYIDIGATYSRYQLDSSNIKKIPTKHPVQLIEKLIDKYPLVSKIFISFAGQVSDGIIKSAPNIDIKDFDIKNYFKDKKIYIQNDVKCAVLAQSHYFNEQNIIALYIGTGMGSGIISGGKIIKGVDNIAGEIGHIAYKKAPFRCGCLKDNCVELFSSGSGIKKWANYYKKEFSTLLELPSGLYEDFLEGVMIAISTLVTIFNPKIVVLGGGVIENNLFIIEYIKENISKYAFNQSLKNLEITLSKIDNAPLVGCKLLEEI